MDADISQQPCPPPAHGNREIELPKHRPPGEPEKYRLSAAATRSGAAKTKPERPVTPITFRFRTRYISGLASDLASDCPHLLDLRIRPSAIASLITRLVEFLPAFARTWVERAFVEWFLPERVVLKMQKQGEDEESTAELFEAEAKAYNRLKPLQGVIVPRCYGQLYYKGTRTLMLERLGGVSLVSPEGCTFTLRKLSDLLQPCYRAIHAFGVHHQDPHLNNFQLVDEGRRLVMLDFERVEFDLSAADNTYFMETNIWDLASRYQDAQAYYRHDGLLEGA